MQKVDLEPPKELTQHKDVQLHVKNQCLFGIQMNMKDVRDQVNVPVTSCETFGMLVPADGRKKFQMRLIDK